MNSMEDIHSIILIGTGTEFRQASRLVMERIAEMRARDEKMFPLPKKQPKTKR